MTTQDDQSGVCSCSTTTMALQASHMPVSNPHLPSWQDLQTLLVLSTRHASSEKGGHGMVPRHKWETIQ